TVVLTQTGSYFNAIGRMSITKSGIKTELISEYTGSDTDVAAIKNNWIAEIDKKLGEVIGHTALTFDNYDKDGNRLVRSQETNTGDFAADALYYLFDNMDLDVDLAIMNGGGVRNKAITGDISYKTCKEIHTFGNVACLIQVTGQQILDALEWGARDVGTAECGGFLQVSGVTYEIHTYITSTVQKDDKGVWTAGPTGEYRVKNVKIGGEPLDLTKTYNMAGYNYTLRDCGDGFAMFKGAANVLDYVMEDYMVLANYVKSFPTKNGKHEIEAQNSVLGANYAEITGEGRITVVPSKGESKDEFVLASEIKGGDEVVIYNPGHGMAIKNETDNDWYLMPETVTPVNNKIVGPDAILVWTVVDNGNGTFSFVNGENKIMMWLSEQGEKTYFELTNNANYEGATGEWKVVSGDAAKNLYYIQHSTLSNSYGPAYIECFYNSNKNTTKISGYSTSSPSANDYGFQFYVKGATTPDPEPTPGNEYVLTSELKEGDEVIIVCAAKNIAFSSEKNPEKNYYNAGVAVTPVDGKITDAPAAIVWTVGKDGENYTFSFNGQKIGMADSFSSTDLGAVNDTWAIETAKTDGAFYLKNLGRNLWLEWYADNNYWSCYKDNSNEELFALNFYVKSAVTPEPTPTPGNEYVLTSELKEGDEVIIVCAAKNIAFSSEKNPEKNYYNAGVAVTPVDGKITDAPAAIVWTVGKDGENYTFSFNGQKIGMADSFSSTDLGAVNDTWAIETAKTDGAFYLKNLGRNLWLEWYADNNYWSCYKDNSNEELFALNFYVKSGSGEAPHVHAWDAGIVTKEATCTEKGVKTFTCECGATKTEEIAALGHIDENNDDVCDRCNADLGTIAAEEYVLASEIKDGDEVVIYNPANSAALSSVASGYNLAPVSVTPVSNAITTNDATIVWTVTKNADGSYTFTQDGGVVLGAEVSGSYTDIYATGEHANTWTLTALSTENLFDITSTTLEGTYGPVFVEYYNNAFKAFSTSRTSSYYSEAAMGFQFYVKGGEAACVHEWDEGKVTTEATCTTAGVKTFTCAKCGATKTEEIEALGHIDENNDDVCDRCNADLGTIVAEEYILASEIKDGDEVVIYNPGHGKAIKNENDNNWYLIAEEITPADSKITTTDTSLVWTVNKNDDGTFTFTNGANAITAWLSGTYVELTNDASYAGGDTKWNVTTCNAETNTFFIGSSSISTSYGTGYIECYTKSGVDKIAGYAKTSPTEYDFGFQFYVKGAEAACAHEWDEGEVTTEATCTTAGVKTFTCAKCEATKTEPIAPLGHIDENGDNVCDRCGADLTPSDYAIADSLTVGDKIIIVAEYEGKYYAVANNIANSALSGEEVTVSGSGLTLPEDADVAWEVCAGSTEGTFTLKNKDGLYIAVPTTGSSKTAVTLADVGTDYAITCGEGTSKIALPGAERSLFLHMNGTIAQFKHYADSNSGSSGYSAVLTIWKAN
ncbi:MAG: 5'-nucleotidase C-terminal domain-containing protein, partial [Faecousia sp.]